MILYKYRSLVNFERTLDIILNQRLYCSPYPELNDPFEGIFETTIYPNVFPLVFPIVFGSLTPANRRGLVGLRSQAYKKVEVLLGGEIDKIKICSLSSDLNDVRLWSYYADGHKGIVFEIDFSGLEAIFHQVQYSEKLPWGAMPHVVRPERVKPEDVLSRKTNHWKFESEYRIIEESKNLSEGKYFDIKGRIKAIYLGNRLSDPHFGLLTKIAGGQMPIYTTKINEGKIIVEPDKLIEGQKESP